jgi:hypothetical protein
MKCRQKVISPSDKFEIDTVPHVGIRVSLGPAIKLFAHLSAEVHFTDSKDFAFRVIQYFPHHVAK